MGVTLIEFAPSTRMPVANLAPLVEQHPVRRRGRRGVSAVGTEMRYPPIRNGMDYLRSLVRHLDREEPGPQDLKYAVLHLQAATEVLLKALLVSLDWTQVFSKPDEADQLAYQQVTSTAARSTMQSSGCARGAWRSRRRTRATSPTSPSSATACNTSD